MKKQYFTVLLFLILKQCVTCCVLGSYIRSIVLDLYCLLF